MTTFSINTKTRDPGRRALLLPGTRYTSQGPLLWYTEQVLAGHGWTTEVLSWDGSPESREEARTVYDKILRRRTAVESEAKYLVVGKSLGTLALPTAVELRVPGVWLTPPISKLFGEPKLRSAVRSLSEAGVPAFFAGGTADVQWDGKLARRGGAVHEVQDANHFLEIPGDWHASLVSVTGVICAVDGFISTLG